MTTKVSIKHRISYHRYVELIKVQSRVKPWRKGFMDAS